MSTTDRIAEHHKKWDALPPFPEYPYVMTDDDVDSWSDLLYFRGLADAIEDQAAKLAADPIGVHCVQLARLHSQADIDVLAGTPPPDAIGGHFWPDDIAAEMLAAWRDGEDWPTEYTDTSRLGLLPGASFWAPAPPRPRWWRRTFHKRIMRRILVALAIAALVIVGIGYAAAPAKASPSPGDGCERINWGLHILTPQKRRICDGPRRADGSWERFRQLWTPAHYVPRRMSCSGYGYITCTEYGGYHVDDQVWEEMTYVVFDYNVLDGEPGWLPPGTAVLR